MIKDNKKVQVQFTISYDRIRQVMCIISGKVLQDSELEELVGNEVINLDVNLLDDSGDMEQVIAAMILTQKTKEKDDLTPKKKSNFEERLERMKKQRT